MEPIDMVLDSGMCRGSGMRTVGPQPGQPWVGVLGACAFCAVLSLAPEHVAAQDARARFGLAVSPTLLVQTTHFSSLDLGSESTGGFALAASAAAPVAQRVDVTGEALFWWGDGRRLEAYTVGPELNLGPDRQFRIKTAFGLLRQPEGDDCVDPCTVGPNYRLRSEPALHLGFSYGLRLDSRWQLGPSASWLRALSGGFRFHVLSLGVRVTRTL
jgi:hypothetical protein